LKVKMRDQSGIRSGWLPNHPAFAFGYLAGQIVCFVTVGQARQNPLYPQPLFRSR
jgi:hypothetical protein